MNNKIVFIVLLVIFILTSILFFWSFSLVKLYFYDPSSFDKNKIIPSKPKRINNYPQTKDYRKNYYFQIYDENQKLITDTIFDNVSGFSENRMSVKKDGLYGVIDLEGNYILKPEYESISQMIFNLNDKEQKNYIFASKTEGFDEKNRKINKNIIFDNNGKQLYSADTIYRDNLFLFVYNNDTKTWNILDSDFKKILEEDFFNKPEIVYGKTKDGIQGKYLIVNNRKNTAKVMDFNGNDIISPGCYSYITYEHNIADDKDYFRVTHKNKTGIITSDNKIIVPVIFDKIERQNKDGKETFWGIKYCRTDDKIFEKNHKGLKRTSSRGNRRHNRQITITKYANYDLNGNFIKKQSINDIPVNYPIWYGSYINQEKVIKKDNFPVRKIVPIVTKKPKINQEKRKLMTLGEVNYYISGNKKSFGQKETNYQLNVIQPPKAQKKHTTVYASDFGKTEIKGDFTRLTLLAKPFFGKLSPNGLSATYCGKESFYIANTNRASGKYYFEVYVENPEKQDIARNTTFSLIHFPLYNTEADAKTYKNSWNSTVNKFDLKLSDYKFQNKDIAGIAIDLDNGRIYLQINGEWMNNPYDKNDGIKILTGKSYYPAFSVAGYKEILTVNFGLQPFKYEMPEGYKMLNSKDETELSKSEQSDEKKYSFLDIE